MYPSKWNCVTIVSHWYGWMTVCDLFWVAVSFTEHCTSPFHLSHSLSLTQTHTQSLWLCSCNDTLHGWMEWKMGRERERESKRRKRAMKGKDEEGGLEKRENREVGQRQPTSDFCVQKCISMHFHPVCSTTVG